MTARHVLSLILVIAIATSIGWLVDFGDNAPSVRESLAPDNIDYYMKDVNYRAFNETGTLHYRLVTPYFEHFIQQDTSHLQTPHIDYYAEDEQWEVRSESGVLQHQQEILTLEDQVRMDRVLGKSPLFVRSQTVILRSIEEQMEIPTHMTLVQDGLTLNAASAMLDMKRKYHQFTRVKAVYHDNKKNSG